MDPSTKDSPTRPCICQSLSSKTHISANQLNCCYGMLYSRADADLLLRECETNFTYMSPEKSKIRVYGKWREIPRQQSAYGDPGVSYTFSGATVPAQPWPAFLTEVRERVRAVCGCDFDFVLVNRYRDGRDYVGEHQDNEKNLDSQAPIASLSLGRMRDFVFKHESVKRGRKPQPPNTDTVKLELQHGSLLVMHPPTNSHWYHALPARKNLLGVRVNLTFRKLKDKPHK